MWPSAGWSALDPFGLGSWSCGDGPYGQALHFHTPTSVVAPGHSGLAPTDRTIQSPAQSATTSSFVQPRHLPRHMSYNHVSCHVIICTTMCCAMSSSIQSNYHPYYHMLACYWAMSCMDCHVSCLYNAMCQIFIGPNQPLKIPKITTTWHVLVLPCILLTSS
jgi:hypothetical protein